MISLLTEQVAGFYDDKTKTVNLLDWIDPDEQKPVLAHELTHALQDQRGGSDEMVGGGLGGHREECARRTMQHIQTDEADTARDAVTEGQAMVVFLDYTLRPLGQDAAEFAGDDGPAEGHGDGHQRIADHWRGRRCCCRSRCCFPTARA